MLSSYTAIPKLFGLLLSLSPLYLKMIFVYIIPYSFPYEIVSQLYIILKSPINLEEISG